MQDLGYNPRQADGTLKPSPLLAMLIFRHYQSRLDRGNLVDGLPLAEDRGIKPYDTGTGANYIDWLLAHASDVDALEGQNFGTGITAPNALLYLMLHNALLQEIRSGIHALFESQAIQSDELIRSRKFMNVMARPDVSPWEVFRAPATRILAGETSTNPLLAYVQDVRFTKGDGAEIGRYVQQQKEALQHLRNASTARLERALAEHIDTLSYRLDSWETALFDRRLRSQRQLGAEQRRTGILLGSYGYLEDVRPSNSRVRVADDTLPAPLREGTDNLFIEDRQRRLRPRTVAQSRDRGGSAPQRLSHARLAGRSRKAERQSIVGTRAPCEVSDRRRPQRSRARSPARVSLRTRTP